MSNISFVSFINYVKFYHLCHLYQNIFNKIYDIVINCLRELHSFGTVWGIIFICILNYFTCMQDDFIATGCEPHIYL